ncbi:hypothetical protein DV702_11535 [Sporosarcina sp. PTS2304]|nr:hypothetical protein DV702_11535 [Sporosarcina sp. PTS2304]
MICLVSPLGKDRAFLVCHRFYIVLHKNLDAITLGVIDMTPLHTQESFQKISSIKSEMEYRKCSQLSKYMARICRAFICECNQLSNEEIKENEYFDEVFRTKY